MMPFPEKFDQNEWFVLLTLCLSILVIMICPKRMPVSIAILIMLSSLISARLADHLLSSPKIDLYNMMDSREYEFFDLILYIVYAPFGYFFVYIYEWLKVKGYWIMVYLFLCSIFGAFFEWLSVKFEVFHYNGWKIEYSFTVYVFIQALTLLLYSYLRKNHVGGEQTP